MLTRDGPFTGQLSPDAGDTAVCRAVPRVAGQQWPESLPPRACARPPSPPPAMQA
jgi:hypothetical protein